MPMTHHPPSHRPPRSGPTASGTGTLTTATATVAPTAPSPHRTFAVRVPSTPRGARQARQTAALRLHLWGCPRGSAPHELIVLVVGELAANAVTHGYVPGRCVLVRMVESAGRLRVEVSDTRGERLPVLPPRDTAEVSGRDEESGRGLALVAALSDACGVRPRGGGAPGKTVWAEFITGADATPAP
ncbi:ATP-binding protein [Streptomyces sp. GC420]|uniref:ATP-binding protein n=1 Tax=Streptomyces sp. GC420 TaxID=2697568 RepID=UPI001414E085|nr:ATP-binding protein [Streptomyces sp. GC420]NBM15866.1 ATP-binding protein [Streptomyces sp. GC420]